MTVLADCRCLWLGTHAAVAGISGWSRDDDFNEEFIQGADQMYTGPTEAGGAHGHTPDADTHTGNAHSHTFSAASASGTTVVVNAPGVSPTQSAQDVHTHTSLSSNSRTIVYGSVVGNVDSATAQPPFVRVIVLKPDDGNQNIPDDCVCWTDETSLPTGFVKTDGNGGTPDLDGKFVLGAVAAGDGGGTGGSATHLHPDGTGHYHVPSAHSHRSKACGDATSVARATGAGLIYARSLVHHSVELSFADAGNTSTTQVPTEAASSEPAHVELLGIQNTSGSAATPDGVILPYVGPVSGISNADGWYLCDGSGGTPDLRNRQIKITTTDIDVGNVGGADEHTHTTAAHGHVHTSGHVHTATVIFLDTGTIAPVTTPAINVINQGTDTHTHTWTIGSTTPTLQDSTYTMSTDDGRDNYRTAVFVKRMSTGVRLRGGKVLGAKIAA